MPTRGSTSRMPWPRRKRPTRPWPRGRAGSAAGGAAGHQGQHQRGRPALHLRLAHSGRLPAPFDATAIERLRSAGALFVGRANMDEFALGSTTEASCYGPSRNPAAPGRVTGGSSGGSAAAVAGGSRWARWVRTPRIDRQPASFCGCVGLKPSYGRISRFGAVACARRWIKSGRSRARCATPRCCWVSWRGRIRAIPPASTSRYPTTWRAARGGARVAAGAAARLFRGGERSRSHGVRPPPGRPVPRRRRRDRRGRPAAHALRRCDLLHHHDGGGLGQSGALRPECGTGRGPTIRKSPEDLYCRTRAACFGKRGQAAHPAGDLRAQQRVLRCLLPAGAQGAHADPPRFRAGVRRLRRTARPRLADARLSGRHGTGRPVGPLSGGSYTVAASLAGICGLSLPCGTTAAGLPVGLQVLGPAFAEDRMLRVAAACEELHARERGGRP